MTDKQPEALRLADLLDEKWHRWKDDPTDELKAAAELRRLQAENEALRAEYQSACGVVARMHLAATGQTIGPKRGVVEDVEDLRAEVEELRSRLQTTLSSGESHEDSLKSRDEALLRQALEVLENGVCDFWSAREDDADVVIAALRARLRETK